MPDIKDTQINELLNKVDDLKITVDNLEFDKLQLQKQLDKVNAQERSTAEMLEKQTADTENRLSNSLERMQSANAAQKQAEQALAEQETQAEEEIAQLREELLKTKDTLIKVSAQRDQAVHSTTAAQKHNQSNTSEIEELQNQLKQAADDLQQSQQQCEEYHKKLNDGSRENMEDALKVSKDKIQGLQAEIKELEQCRNDLISTNEDLTLKLEQATQEISSGTRSLDHSQHQINQLESKLNERIEDLEDRNALLLKKIDDREQEIDDLRQELKVEQDKVEQLQAWETSQKMRTDEVEERVSTSEKKKGAAVRLYEEATVQLESNEQEIKTLNLLLRQAQDDLRKAKRELAAVELDKRKLQAILDD